MSPPQHDPFTEAVGQLGPPLLGALAALEHARRHLHPQAMGGVREGLAAISQALGAARQHFAAAAASDAPGGLEGFARQLGDATDHACEALGRFESAAVGGPDVVPQVLAGMHLHHRAEAALYPLRRALPPVSRFFVEDAFADRLAELDPETPGERTGLHNASNDPGERGGFSLYVPESVRPGEKLPLIVALHGGSGHGADFLWTWLREARSRRCLLLAPTSRGATWSLMGPDIDTPSLRRMVEFAKESWAVDEERVLLTGLSDGATYALLTGLLEDSPFTAFAPACGVLHPANFANGNIGRARGKRIYLVHGALDWMFPVTLARAAAEELEKAGAELLFREVEDLSHTYPREENAKILEWFDPSLRPASRHA